MTSANIAFNEVIIHQNCEMGKRDLTLLFEYFMPLFVCVHGAHTKAVPPEDTRLDCFLFIYHCDLIEENLMEMAQAVRNSRKTDSSVFLNGETAGKDSFQISHNRNHCQERNNIRNRCGEKRPVNPQLQREKQNQRDAENEVSQQGQTH